MYYLLLPISLIINCSTTVKSKRKVAIAIVDINYFKIQLNLQYISRISSDFN